jgi:pimeloyl-ACP methyl ester carboxylesterase
MKRGYADTPEGQVHYITEGSGKPLLLLHMTPLSSSMYRRLIPHLSKARRVIAMDTLGFGNSDPAPSSYTNIGDYARNVAHFLDAMAIEQTDLLGSYTGSVIAAEVAVQFPERVSRQVLFPYAMWLTEEERAKRIEEAKKTAAITPKADGSHVLDALRHAYGRNVDKENPVENPDFEYMDGWIADAVKAGPRISEIALKVYCHVSENRLPLVKAPTLVIGLGGEIVKEYNKPDRAKLMHALIPGSQYVEMSGADADSRVFYARRNELAEIILPFLEGKSP